jgi:hypothetical protein
LLVSVCGLGAAKQKFHQKVMISDFDTQKYYQKSISSKNGNHHLICNEILHQSLIITFHLEPMIVKPIPLIQQKGFKPTLFDGFVTPPSTIG